MENNWKEVYLGDISDVQTGPFGSQLKNEQYIKGGTPVVTVEHIKDFRITDFDYPSITDEDKDRLAKYLMKTDDILFTRVGSVDLSAYVSEKQNGWMFSSRMLRVRTNEEVHSKFLSYYFQQRSFRDYILNISVGATMPSINTSILKSLIISYPPLPEQKAIASVLSSLDDKIDLLHQQNQTLEALAETLFRQWFIERCPEPVEGEAKEDWEDCTIGDLAIHSKLSVHPNRNPDTLYHHYSIPAFDANKKPVVEFGKEIQSNKYKVEENSILFSKLNPHKDKRVWLIQDSVEEHAICSTELQVVKPKDNDYLYFIYGWLTNSIYYNEIASGVGGTSGSHQRIEPKAIFSAPCVKIKKDIILQYNLHAKPLFKKQLENSKQIQTLTQMRDTLLPKLMSGEVRVKI